MIHGLKDAALSKSILLAANAKWKRYGKILDLDLNSRNRTIQMEILLKGEMEPIRLKVPRYEITEENGRCYLHVERIESSREWIDLLGNEYLKNHRIEIPNQFAHLFKKLL